MRKTLVMDAETREMRVRYEDLWRGEHEVTEYRVMDRRVDGDVVRNLAALHGRAVLGNVPDLHLSVQWPASRMQIWTQETPVGPTVKTPCPKATNARRKCALCSA